MRVILIGLGTVGQGVAELLARHRDLYAQKIGEPIELAGALVRDPAKPREVELPASCRLTADPDELFVLEADLMIEAAGGVEFGAAQIRRALERGLDVVTANKAAVARHGTELFTLAERERRRLGIEATVAGGVPIVEMLTTCLASNAIASIAGITNGTCHFIIRAMERGRSYDEALAEAQQLGFAEADPTLDVSGRDSAEKLAILASLAFGAPVPVDAIPCKSIQGLAPDDLGDAHEQGMRVRLLGVAHRAADRTLELYNGPCLVPADSLLGRCPPEEMAAVVQGDAVPAMALAGFGAGRFPTASAVVADVIKLAASRSDREGRLNPWPIGVPPPALAPIVRDASWPVVA